MIRLAALCGLACASLAACAPIPPSDTAASQARREVADQTGGQAVVRRIADLGGSRFAVCGYVRVPPRVDPMPFGLIVSDGLADQGSVSFTQAAADQCGDDKGA